MALYLWRDKQPSIKIIPNLFLHQEIRIRIKFNFTNNSLFIINYGAPITMYNSNYNEYYVASLAYGHTLLRNFLQHAEEPAKQRSPF